MITTRFVLVIFITIFANTVLSKSQNIYQFIEYNVELSENKKYLIVNAKYTGNFLEKEILNLPHKWADQDYFLYIKDVKNIDKTNKIFIDKRQANHLIVNFIEPTKIFAITYEIHSPQNTNFDIKKTLIYRDLIHATGRAFLTTPANIDDKERVLIKFTWKNLPKQWNALSSHGKGNDLAFTSTIPALLHSIYIAGDIRNYTKYIKGIKKVNFSLYGKFTFTDKQIIDNALKTITTQRDFFDDYNFDNYLISILENTDGNEKLALMGGAGFNNSFTAHMSKNISLKQYQLLFAHEHLHNWIGGKIQNSEEILNYWWSEGFTDYYSRVLSARDGTLNLNDFVEEINTILEEYYKSSSINLRNLEIDKKFWNSWEAQQIPYLRGFVFALYLDCELKSKNLKNSTEIILRHFFENHSAMKFSNKNFVRLFKEYGYFNKTIDTWFDDYIELGKTIKLDCCNTLLPINKISFINTSNNQIQNNFYQFQSILEDNSKSQIKAFFKLEDVPMPLN